MMAVSDKSTYKETDLRGCLTWTFQLITFAGYWFPKSDKRSATYLYAAYSVVVVGCTLITCLSMQIAYVFYVFGQLEEMINTVFVLLTHSTQVVKVMAFIYQRKKIYQLLENLQEDIFKPRSNAQFKKAKAIKNYTNTMAKSLVTLVIAAVCLFALFPLLEKGTTRQLPVRGWFPFDATVSPVYEAVYVYQVISILICGCANAAMDTIAAAFMSQISIQLDMLRDSIRHVKNFAIMRLKEKKPTDDSFTSTENCVSAELEHEMNLFLLECHIHHLKLKQ